MGRKLGVVLDPIAHLNLKKDSSIAMLRAAAKRDWEIYYFTADVMYLDQGVAMAQSQIVTINEDEKSASWYSLADQQQILLGDMDAILMRKDPPFDMNYVYATHILDRAEAAGALVVNPPAALRDCNEKIFTTWFPECTPATLICHSREQVREFLALHGDVIVKPPDGMGGMGIFRLQKDGPNVGAILETLLPDANATIIAQQFIPAVTEGDKRILLIDGEPVPYGLARLPAAGETRANLAAGGRGVGQALTERELWICEQVKPEIKRRGLLFVGLDVIGGYLTEVNVTSPTCIRELDDEYGLDIGGQLMDAIAAKLNG
jgi:glutathione synthase